ELLAVGRAAARIGVEHDVTLGRHPVEFVRERVAVRCVRPAVDLKNERILFRRVEMRWLEDPPLNPLAVEAVVPDFFRRAEFERAEKSFVHARDLGRRAASAAGINYEE